MRRHDVVPSPMHEIEDMRESMPEWLALASQVLEGWGSGRYLSAVLAAGLKEAYERGAAGLPPPSRLKLTAKLEDEFRQPARATPAVGKRTRIRPEPPPPEPTTRVRRTR